MWNFCSFCVKLSKVPLFKCKLNDAKLNLIMYFNGSLQLRNDWQDTRCWLWKHLVRLKLEEMTLPLCSGQKQPVGSNRRNVECFVNRFRVKYLYAMSQQSHLNTIRSDLAIKIKWSSFLFVFHEAWWLKIIVQAEVVTLHHSVTITSKQICLICLFQRTSLLNLNL